MRNEWRNTSLYPTSYRPQHGPRYFSLHLEQWPPDIVEGCRKYQTRCGLRIRETTFKGYKVQLTIYLGYLANICGRSPTWGDMFDPARLMDFIRWHAARMQRPISYQGYKVVCHVRRHGQGAPASHARALADLRNELPSRPRA